MVRNKKLLILFASIIFLFGIIKIYKIVEISFKENVKKQTIKEMSVSLNNCFDIKNKSKRTFIESIKLIEYCMINHSSY